MMHMSLLWQNRYYRQSLTSCLVLLQLQEVQEICSKRSKLKGHNYMGWRYESMVESHAIMHSPGFHSCHCQKCTAVNNLTHQENSRINKRSVFARHTVIPGNVITQIHLNFTYTFLHLFRNVVELSECLVSIVSFSSLLDLVVYSITIARILACNYGIFDFVN